MASITAQRGARPILLDRPRLLFYNLASTWLLVERYGLAFALELYGVDNGVDNKGADNKGADKGKEGRKPGLRLKSKEALRYFLWAGLQAEMEGTGEKLTIEQAGEMIRPWNISEIFMEVVLALSGAMRAAEPERGKSSAAGPAEPAVKGAAAAAKKGGRKTGTLTMRRGLRLQR